MKYIDKYSYSDIIFLFICSFDCITCQNMKTNNTFFHVVNLVILLYFKSMGNSLCVMQGCLEHGRWVFLEIKKKFHLQSHQKKYNTQE